MSEFTLTKGERLTGKKAITELFRTGRVQISNPVRILYQATTGAGAYPAYMAISIPKRLFKKAVDRNLLKRRIREIYRHFKPEFYGQLRRAGIQIHLVIQYNHSEIMEFKLLEEALHGGLKKVLSDLTG